jgi:hypothetical protein
VHYRRFLLRERIKAVDENKDILVNLLGALHLLRKAWNEVKPETITNCIRHAKFIINDEVRFDEEIVEVDKGLDELLAAWTDLQLLGEVNNEALMEDYMAVDLNVATGLCLLIGFFNAL